MRHFIANVYCVTDPSRTCLLYLLKNCSLIIFRYLIRHRGPLHLIFYTLYIYIYIRAAQTNNKNRLTRINSEKNRFYATLVPPVFPIRLRRINKTINRLRIFMQISILLECNLKNRTLDGDQFHLLNNTNEYIVHYVFTYILHIYFLHSTFCNRSEDSFV